MSKIILRAVAAIATLLLAAPASAHLELIDPPSRYGGNVLKTAPCGQGDGERTDNVTTYEAGSTITIVFDEYINHPGHFRVAFDDDGHDDFVDPKCVAECDNGNMEIELYGDPTVLLDGIEDKNGGEYQVDVELPNTPCDNCTLQVIQVMTDKPPYTDGGNDLYFQCADLILTEPTGDDTGTGTPDMGTGGDAGTQDAGGNNGTPNNTTTNNAPNNSSPNNTLNNSSPNNSTTNGGSADMGMGGADGGSMMSSTDDGGCCRTLPGNPRGGVLLAVLFGLVVVMRRRRQSSSTDLPADTPGE